MYSRRAYLRLVGTGVGATMAAAGGASAEVERLPPEAAESGSWGEREPLPVLQSDAGGGVLDGELYYFGGFETGTGLDAVRRTLVFDPEADDGDGWREVEPMPRALWAPCGVASERKLFSFGGAPSNGPYGGENPPSDVVFRYTPDDGWTNLTEAAGVRCPYPNWGMKGAYNPDDGLVYCVGGGTNVTDRESASNHGADSRTPGTFDESRIWAFDPKRETVADPDLARMPEAKRWPAVALVASGGRQFLHAIAGRRGGAGPTASNYRYDFDRHEWSEMTPAPRGGNYGTTDNPVVDNDVYLSHGIFWSPGDDLSTDIYGTVCHQYDPEEDAFRRLSSPRYPRTGPVDAVIDGTLYVVGGHVKRYDEDGLHECVEHNETFSV
ncbi:hypothetical protein SAMN04488063_2878 [Halopelagius inordinatus]|uniref:N-acetylneuraminic acid mutarotase n=1 Tax=Halopelagius inordinatus TaxID=553467 RepID=A0A1I2UIN6_9EURY|nr:hypothetical protein [Halopelagius inordinatus]SFG76910.1 hypothetical protein SAMN04488063_2878 [Halopelagius inordinatus]